MILVEYIAQEYTATPVLQLLNAVAILAFPIK